ncbi:MAG: ATP phosphoribosyltransferase [Phycisphaerales bacterium]|nr:ATP phosphoribosyltransferase [Phycisphaerales bacterium]
MSPLISPDNPLRIGLPKGRMHDGVLQLLAEAGIRVSTSARGYRPTLSLPGLECKILKPQNIVEMLGAGTRELGFAGADWVSELNADVVEVLDTGLDQVRVVVAAPRQLVVDGRLPDRSLVVTSEFDRLARRWIAGRGRQDKFVRSYGATEVFPPEDADCIIDIAASGATLEANSLVIVEEVMKSSTRLYASRAAWDDPARREQIETIAMLLRSVIDARRRVMLELNVPADRLEAVVAVLPCMREPTMARLHGDAGFAVKAAVPRDRLPSLIPLLKARGGSDIVISPLSQVVP